MPSNFTTQVQERRVHTIKKSIYLAHCDVKKFVTISATQQLVASFFHTWCYRIGMLTFKAIQFINEPYQEFVLGFLGEI